MRRKTDVTFAANTEIYYQDFFQTSTHLNVCMSSSVWTRSCFWIGVSTPHQIFPHPLFLFTLYFIIIISIFTFILYEVAFDTRVYRPLR
jgi:magnesium-transporting ATPase (P-type)